MELKLGRVIIDKEVDIDFSFKNKNRNIITIENEFTESKLPTLIVGWAKAESIYQDNISILNKKIKHNIFWTFSPKEKMQNFNEDTVDFINKLYFDFIKNYEYTFIDPVIDNITKLKHILRFSSNGCFDCSYITDDFIYMFCKDDNLILGIDLSYYQSLGFKVDLLTDLIQQKSEVSLIEDYSDTGVYQIYKNHLQSEIDKKYIPALYYANR